MVETLSLNVSIPSINVEHNFIVPVDMSVEVAINLMSLSQSTVKRAVKDLEKAGLIRKEPHYRENGSATSNRYYLL